MEIKLQQQVTGTAMVDLTVPETSEPEMKKQTNKKKTEGEEKVLIYMKESQVESSPECPEWSSIRSPLPVKED